MRQRGRREDLSRQPSAVSKPLSVEGGEVLVVPRNERKIKIRDERTSDFRPQANLLLRDPSLRSG